MTAAMATDGETADGSGDTGTSPDNNQSQVSSVANQDDGNAAGAHAQPCSSTPESFQPHDESAANHRPPHTGVQKHNHKHRRKGSVKGRGPGRGPGRPPGSLNRSTIARLKAEAEAIEAFKRSHPDIPTYSLDQLNPTNQTARGDVYDMRMVQNAQYYSLPVYYPDQSSGHLLNPAYGNLPPYQLHQRSKPALPYILPPPPPPPPLQQLPLSSPRQSQPLPPPPYYSPQTVNRENRYNSLAMQTRMQTSLSEGSHRSRRASIGSDSSKVHSRNASKGVNRQSAGEKLPEQPHNQQRYTSIVLPPTNVNFHAYPPPFTNTNYQGSNTNGEIVEYPNRAPHLVPHIPPQHSFATHRTSQSYSLQPIQAIPTNMQHGSPVPVRVPIFPPNTMMQQVPLQYSAYPQYPAYQQGGNIPFAGPIQSYQYDSQHTQQQRLNDEQHH